MHTYIIQYHVSGAKRHKLFRIRNGVYNTYTFNASYRLGNIPAMFVECTISERAYQYFRNTKANVDAELFNIVVRQFPIPPCSTISDPF